MSRNFEESYFVRSLELLVFIFSSVFKIFGCSTSVLEAYFCSVGLWPIELYYYLGSLIPPESVIDLFWSNSRLETF